MLYFYKYVNTHPMQNMHAYMHYFFECLFAEVSKVYSRADYIHPDFVSIIDEYDEQIETYLIETHKAYMSLTDPADKKRIQDAYTNNNNTEGICYKTVKPYKFDELPVSIQVPIRKLYDSNGALYKMLSNKKSYKAIKNRCGSLKGHFEKFRELNPTSVCPFCGMENLITEYEDGKNEYDHYISKGDYPFCSVNFINLVPVCDYCNKSGNKGTKDIPFIPKVKPQVQEELYFPYSTAYPNHEIILTINSTTTDLSDPDQWSLDINCVPKANNVKKDRWVEIYNIQSRYKGKIAKDSYKWKDTIISEFNRRCKKRGDTFPNFKEDILERFKDYNNWNNGIHMKTFDDFFMNYPRCEDILNGRITI